MAEQDTKPSEGMGSDTDPSIQTGELGEGPAKAENTQVEANLDQMYADRAVEEGVSQEYMPADGPVGRPPMFDGAESNSASAPASSAAAAADNVEVDESSLETLGPAFPEEEPSNPAISPGTRAPKPKPEKSVTSTQTGDGAPLPAPASEAPTNARPMDSELPSLDGEVSVDLPPQHLGHEPSPADPDLWAEFDDKSGWSSVTGQSKVKKRRRTGSVSDAAPAPQPQQKEYSRRNTNVYGPGKSKRGKQDQGARLVCIKGKDQGREFEIVQKELTIGRGPNNAIVLEEPSVSREHARIVYDGDRYVLIDQRSGNGSFVNGNKVDRARVRSGDEVGFGNARFRFLEIGDVFKPVDASGAPVLPGAASSGLSKWAQSPGFRNIVLSVEIVVITALLATMILLLKGGSKPSGNSDLAFQYYTEAVEQFKRRQWPQAEQRLNVLLGLDPAHARGRRYLEAVGRERQIEKILVQAKAYRKQGNLVQAYSQAATIRDSIYEPEARQLISGINGELDARIARARTALEAGQAAEALTLLQAVTAIRGGRPDVLALLDSARRALPSGQAPPAPGAPAPAPAPGPTPVRSPAPTPSAPRAAPAYTAPAPAATGLAAAKSLFAAGRIDESLRAIGADQSRDGQVLRAKITKFNERYTKALTEHKAKKTGPAIKALRQARAFESKITGGNTPLAREISRKLADMHFVEGIQAYNNGRLPESYRSFRAAVSSDSGHKLSKRKLEELVQRARDLYQEGYVLKDTDPGAARAKWKRVMQIVPSDHEVYKKAKRRLDSLP